MADTEPVPPLLEIADLRKSFGGTQALKGVSLTVRRGEALGLAGENGAGKSTLMNLLGGVLQPTSGSMRWEGQPYQPRAPRDAAEVGLAFIHQELNLFPNLSVAENLFIPNLPRRSLAGGRAIDRRKLREESRQALQQVGLTCHPDVEAGRLSAGERQLVEIAKALRQSAKLILFDEPTTSLSSREKDRLFALIPRLKERGIAMIYISHALDDLAVLCDRVAALRDGELVGEGVVEEMPRPRLISLMIGRSMDQAFPERTASPGGKTLLMARSFRGSAMRAPVDLDLRESEILGVAGLMGAGRTELLRALFGSDRHLSGELECAGARIEKLPLRQRIRQGLAMVTESRSEDGLCLEASVRDNFLLASIEQWAPPPLKWIRRQSARQAVETMRKEARLDPSARLDQPVEQLSGGNQQKTVFGKWLLRRPRVFLMDEPTRGVDVGAKFEIYSLIDRLTQTGAGIVIVSSEIEELIGICDRIVVMREGRLVRSFGRTEFDREALLEAAIAG